MRSIEDRDRERTAFLLALYEMADGERTERVNTADIAARLGIGSKHGVNLLLWLKDHRLADTRPLALDAKLTPAGVDEAERILRHGVTVPYSLIVLSSEELRAVEEFLSQYRRAESAGELPLDGEALLEADAEVRTIEAQVHSPKPKRRVIGASLRELHSLLQAGYWERSLVRRPSTTTSGEDFDVVTGRSRLSTDARRHAEHRGPRP